MTALAQTEDDRPLWPAIVRGWRRRCPNCGAGPVLRGYLTVRESCPVCHEALHHQRADDGPAYITILIVGHIMGPALLWAFVKWRPDPLNSGVDLFGDRGCDDPLASAARERRLRGAAMVTAHAWIRLK